MLALAATTLLTIPLSWPLRRAKTAATPVASAPGIATAATDIGLRQQLRIAMRDRSYLYLHAGFFTCGFHIAFLITHLPGEVALCSLPASVSATSIAIIGLFNIAGSLTAGALSTRYRMKHLLALMYTSRGVIILLYLLAPKTTLTFYVFAAALGFTWLATVPPTAGIVGKLFGMRYPATTHGCGTRTSRSRSSPRSSTCRSARPGSCPDRSHSRHELNRARPIEQSDRNRRRMKLRKVTPRIHDQ
jgi:hypothetical protein